MAKKVSVGIPLGTVLGKFEKSGLENEDMTKAKVVLLTGVAAIAKEKRMTGFACIGEACRQSLKQDLGIPLRTAGVLLDLGAQKGSGEKFKEALNEALADLAQSKKKAR